MRTCLNCGKPFSAVRPWQRFCCDKCRMGWHNRERTERTVKLTTALWTALTGLASAHGCPVSEMACRMLHQACNPDGRTLGDEEIYGREAGKGEG